MPIFKSNLMDALEARKVIREQNYRGVPKLIQTNVKADVLKAANNQVMLFPVQLGSSIKSLRISSDIAFAALDFNLGVYYSDGLGNYTESVTANAFGAAVSGILVANETKELLIPSRKMKTVYEVLEPAPITQAFTDEMKKHRKDHFVYLGLAVTTVTAAVNGTPLYFTAEVVESSPSCSQWKGEIMGEN